MNTLSPALVLMSVYRPQMDFLRAQLKSIGDAAIEAELHMDIHVHIDELKTDPAVVEKVLSGSGMRAYQLTQGDNIGYAKSFLKLVEKAPPGYRWYFFADQDDLWQVGRLSHINGVIECDTDMYIGNSVVFENRVPADLSEGPDLISPEAFQRARKRTFAKAFISYGHNIALSEAFVASLPRDWPVGKVASHDKLIYYWARLHGASIQYDETSTVLYRQHAAQVVGAVSSLNRVQKNLVCFRELLTDLNNCLPVGTSWWTRAALHWQAFREFFL